MYFVRIVFFLREPCPVFRIELSRNRRLPVDQNLIIEPLVYTALDDIIVDCCRRNIKFCGLSGFDIENILINYTVDGCLLVILDRSGCFMIVCRLRVIETAQTISVSVIIPDLIGKIRAHIILFVRTR